jgi:soluble lytic murein transglycosylase-like protein
LRRFGAAPLVIAAVMSSMLLADCAAGAEPAPPMIPREGGPTADPFAAFIAEASQRFGVPASWIRSVMRVESAGDVHALSPKGAMGLMQIMPETWAILRARYGLGADPYDPHDNILAGAAYMRELHDRYHAAGFLAAYNAGPARYEDHLATGQPLPAETRAYLAALAPMIADEHVDDAATVAVTTRSWTEATLFAVRADRRPIDAQSASGPQSSHPSHDGAVDDLTALAPQSHGLFVHLTHRNSTP